MSKKGKKKNQKSNNLLDRLEECDRGGQFELDLSQLKLEIWPTETMVVPNIATLKAYGNLWNTVPGLDAFKGLESIDLSRCKITNLDESNLTGLHRLKFLDLSRNELTEIPDDITHLPLLQNINLSRNQISKLPKDVKGMVSIRVIDLSHNSLTNIGSIFDELPNLHEIDFINNPDLDENTMSIKTRRLFEKKQLLRSKRSRRVLINRALGIRHDVLVKEQKFIEDEIAKSKMNHTVNAFP